MYSTNTFSPARRNQFASMQVETASNAQILTLCFDRLDRDLALGRASIQDGNHFAANEALGHAQDLIGELAMMIDVAAWEHAGSLLSVYDYLLRLLAAANIHKSESMVAEAQHLVSELGSAFREASATPVEPATRPAGQPAGSDDAPTARWSAQA